MNDQFYAKGKLHVGGTFKCQSDVSALQGIKVDGILKTQSTLHSQETIHVRGKIKVQSNVIANDLIIEVPKSAKIFGINSEIQGEIAVQNTVDIERTKVQGSIQARNVIIREGCTINGPIYYSETYEVHPTAVLHSQPQQI